MNVNKCDISEGINWLACGWKIFVPQWLMWIVVGLIFIGITFASMLIPLIGSLLYNLVMPALIAGLIWSAHEVEKGKELDATWLFEGLTNAEHRVPLLMLGAIWMGCVLVGTLLFFSIVGTSALTALMGQELTPEMFAGLILPVMLGALLMFSIQLLGAMAMFYGVPLVILDKVPPLQAIQMSFRACLTNFLPLLIFGIALIILGVLAVIPFFLGLLVLLPLSFCANYCSYKAVFKK